MTLQDVCAELGWQGGTMVDALREIQRLRSVERMTNRIMCDLAFQSANGKCRIHPKTTEQIGELNKIINHENDPCK